MIAITTVCMQNHQRVVIARQTLVSMSGLAKTHCSVSSPTTARAEVGCKTAFVVMLQTLELDRYIILIKRKSHTMKWRLLRSNKEGSLKDRTELALENTTEGRSTHHTVRRYISS